MEIIIPPTMKDLMLRGWYDIPAFGRDFLNHEFHSEQEEVLRGMRLRGESAIVTGNRWGKGDVIKVYGAWIATYKPVEAKFKDRRLDLLSTSISQDQANIVFDKFMDTCMECPRWSWIVQDVKRSPFPHIEFKTGITWWFRNASQNGKFLEGRSYYWGNFDEADLMADFPWFLEEILGPRYWDFGGHQSWTTTPRRGKRNAAKRYAELEKGAERGDDVFVYRGDSRNNTFLSSKAREKMDALPARLKNKNVLGIFEDVDGVLTPDVLDTCERVSEGLESEPSGDGARYVNTWDFARTHTWNVGVTIEIGDPLQLRSVERMQDTERRDRDYWRRVVSHVERRHDKWRGVTGIDGTGLGDVVDGFLTIPRRRFNFGDRGLRAEMIDLGISTIIGGGIGLPLEDRRLNCVGRDGEYWSAREELLDFDPDHLDKIVWDFVCALFMGIYLARGRRPGKGKKEQGHRVAVPKTVGSSRYAMVQR